MPPIRFGEFTLDEERRQVLRGNTPVSLEPKAWELLRLLLSRRPKALSKPQIRDAVWPESFVSETTLAGLVADVRAALGDDARQPLYVRTLYGFGYAFCGTAVEEPTRPSQPASDGPGCRLLWAGREVSLGDGEHELGREETCVVCSRSVRVSRRHARVTVRSGRAVLEDLGSRNGTRVGGRLIDGPVELANGDAIEIGPETILFLGAGASASTVSDSG